MWSATLILSASAFLGFVDFAAAQEEQVDSAQLRIIERLRSLARPPGYDSVLYVLDSVRLAQAPPTATRMQLREFRIDL